MSIHVIEVSSVVLEFAIYILHLLPHAVPASMGEFESKLPELIGVAVVKRATCMVRAGVCVSRIR